MIEYLKGTLGLHIAERDWKDAEKLPLFLRSNRHYSVLSVEDTELLLIRMEAKSFNLTAFQKQLKKLKEHWGGETALCFERLSTYQRKALIEQRISFIVPGSQLYLPSLGMVLQERTASEKKEVSKLSASSQFLMLYLLYQTGNICFNKVELSKKLGVSAMNITRAVQELESLEMVTVRKSGRSDYVKPVCNGRQLYDKARPYLIDPVQKRVFARKCGCLEELPLSGESALAGRTMLNPPSIPCVAIGRKEYKELSESHIELTDPAWYGGTDCIELEVWKYDPRVLADGGMVDAVSLAVSFASHKDERIQIAVDEMMEGYRW